MYWDIEGLSPSRAADLARYLDRNTEKPGPAYSEPQQGGDLQHPYSLSTLTPVIRQSEETLPTNISLPASSSPYIPQLPTSLSARTAAEPRYLELCVNTGEFKRSVSETNLSCVASNGELFELISMNYYKTRGTRGFLQLRAPNILSQCWGRNRLRWSFLKPTSIIFRKVSYLLESGRTKARTLISRLSGAWQRSPPQPPACLPTINAS